MGITDTVKNTLKKKTNESEKKKCTTTLEGELDSYHFLERVLYIEYSYGYQNNQHYGIFIYLPDSLLVEYEPNQYPLSKEATGYKDMFNSKDLIRTINTDIYMQCTSVKIQNLGTTVSISNVSEKLPISILTSVPRIDEITTEIYGYYPHSDSLNHLSLFFQKWLSILGWSSNPVSCNKYLKKIYESQSGGKFKSTSNLYKANMIVCSYRQTQKDPFNKEIKQTTSFKVNINASKREIVGTIGRSIDSKMRFFVVEEAYLCLGIFPKSISGMGEYDRNNGEIRKYSVTWNTDYVYTSPEIIYSTQILSDKYFRENGYW